MPRVPKHYAPFIYGVIQSGLTTAIATGIAAYQMTGFDSHFAARWMMAWGFAWLTMLPIVIGFSPLIQRAVNALTEPGS